MKKNKLRKAGQLPFVLPCSEEASRKADESPEALHNEILMQDNTAVIGMILV